MARMMLSKLVAIGALAIALAGLARWRGAGNVLHDFTRTASSGSTATERREPLVTPYAGGRWRLAAPSELERSLLWGAHILVAHRDTPPGVVPFRLPEWRPVWPGPERSRREAWQRAERLALEARSHPERFAELARNHSDDVATRDLGGSLGGITADQLRDWPGVLDAFSAIGPGEVSRVIETDYGFHVLLRKAPPPEERVSGARLVIAYDRAPWLHRFLGYRPIPARTREEAFELARELHGRLRERPEEFERLVHQYSDHRDALRAGDFGAWSTREPTPFPREVEVLAGLRVGEVAPPLDSPFGVEILKRTPDRPRAAFGAAALERNFDPLVEDFHPDSRASVRSSLSPFLDTPARGAVPLAPGVSTTGRESPPSFERSMSWVEGRGDASDEAMLRKLAIGERAPELVERGSSIALLQRQEPMTQDPAPVRLGLPEPAAPDLLFWLSHHGSAALFDAVERRARQTPSLASVPEAALAKLTRYGTRIEKASSTEAAASSVRELELECAAVLGAEGCGRYLGLLTRYVEERLLHVTVHSGHPATLDGMPLRSWPDL